MIYAYAFSDSVAEIIVTISILPSFKNYLFSLSPMYLNHVYVNSKLYVFRHKFEVLYKFFEA